MPETPESKLKKFLLAMSEKLNPPMHKLRYGVSPEVKHKILVERAIPGMPEPFAPGGDVNPAASRYVSNALGAAKWGQGPAELFNAFRLIGDRNVGSYEKGLEGQLAGKELDVDLLVKRLSEMREMP